MQAFSLAATFVALKYPVSASSMSALPNDSGYAANYISKLTKDRPLNTFFGSAKFMWGAPLFHQVPRPFVALIQALDSVRFNRIRSRGRVRARFQCSQRIYRSRRRSQPFRASNGRFDAVIR